MDPGPIWKYLSFSLWITIISWLVGMAVNALLRKSPNYDRYFSRLNFIQSDRLNRIIGLGPFTWLVKNTFFKFFNQKLKPGRRVEKSDLLKLRHEMTTSEIDHLIGFVFVCAFALVVLFRSNVLSFLIMMMVNMLMNLFPSLLQRENKRRIGAMFARFP